MNHIFAVQIVNPEPATLALPGNLLEMQDLRPHLRLPEPESEQPPQVIAHDHFRSTGFFFLNFYWSIVDLQCCVSFRCTME